MTCRPTVTVHLQICGALTVSLMISPITLPASYKKQF